MCESPSGDKGGLMIPALSARFVAMSARPIKHSLTLRGHRTSVSMEDAFWQAFRAAALQRGLTLNALAADIDNARDGDVGLASAIRVYLLKSAMEK